MGQSCVILRSFFMANQKLASFVGVKDPYHDWGCFVEPIYDNI